MPQPPDSRSEPKLANAQMRSLGYNVLADRTLRDGGFSFADRKDDAQAASRPKGSKLPPWLNG